MKTERSELRMAIEVSNNEHKPAKDEKEDEKQNKGIDRMHHCIIEFMDGDRVPNKIHLR